MKTTARRRSCTSLLVLSITCVTATADAGRQGQTAAGRTVWDGIYTAEQAARGRNEYMKACASCHAEDLRGRTTAPSLVDDSFAFLWGEMPVGELFERIRKLMPSDRPNSLPAQSYVDIVAFILESNKLPAGPKELEPDPEPLRHILITMKRPGTTP